MLDWIKLIKENWVSDQSWTLQGSSSWGPLQGEVLGWPQGERTRGRQMGAGRGTLRLGLKVKTTAEVARISKASTSSPCPLSATVKVRGVGLQGDTTLKHITITSKQTRHHPERKDTPRKHENTSLPGIFPGNGINPSFSHLKTAGYEDKNQDAVW